MQMITLRRAVTFPREQETPFPWDTQGSAKDNTPVWADVCCGRCQNERKITRSVIKSHGWGMSGRKNWNSEELEQRQLGFPLHRSIAHRSIVSFNSSRQNLLQRKDMVNWNDWAVWLHLQKPDNLNGCFFANYVFFLSIFWRANQRRNTRNHQGKEPLNDFHEIL